MCQLCVRSGFWGLWKLFQLSQVRRSRCLCLLVGESRGLMLGVGLFQSLSSAPFPPFSSHWWNRRALSLSRRGVPSRSSMVVLVSCSCAYLCVVSVCVLCVMGFCSVCHPASLQIYNRVCGPWECLGAENVQGSPSIENYFCHSRWDSHLNTKAELIWSISFLNFCFFNIWECYTIDTFLVHFCFTTNQKW